MIDPGNFAWTFTNSFGFYKSIKCRHKWKALHACVLTERDQESSNQRASALLGVKCASLCVKTSVFNQTMIIKDKETNGDAACHVGTSKLQYVPLHKAFLIRVQCFCGTLASSYCFSDLFWSVKASNSFHFL